MTSISIILTISIRYFWQMISWILEISWRVLFSEAEKLQKWEARQAFKVQEGVWRVHSGWWGVGWRIWILDWNLSSRNKIRGRGRMSNRGRRLHWRCRRQRLKYRSEHSKRPFSTLETRSRISSFQSHASRRDREFLPFSLMFRDEIENFFPSVSCFETRSRISVFTLVLRDETEKNVEKIALLLRDCVHYYQPRQHNTCFHFCQNVTF